MWEGAKVVWYAWESACGYGPRTLGPPPVEGRLRAVGGYMPHGFMQIHGPIGGDVEGAALEVGTEDLL